MFRTIAASCVFLLFTAATVSAAEWGLKDGTVELQSAGPLAFGPDGILFVGDTKAATVYALDTGVSSGSPANVKLNVAAIDKAVAAALGGKGVQINDLAVNPLSGDVFLSVTNDGAGAIARLTPAGKITELSTKKIPFAKAALPDAPEDKVSGEGRRRRNRRSESITDLAYVDGKVLVSGLSNAAKGASTVRELAFPFTEADPGLTLEIFHGAHGRTEDYAPVRTFVPFNIDGEPSVLAGFTCTPLVKFPIKDLTGEKKVKGTTIAELGNRNRPLDMIVYKQDGKHFVLMANSARGVMKISTEGIDKNKGLTERVGGGGTAGQPYETIKSLTGVVQLDKLNDTHAVIIAQTDGGLKLKTVALP